MSTITRHILNGVEYIQPRQSRDLTVLAIFDGDSVQANITTSTFNFVDIGDSKANTAIKTWFETLPTEGMPYTIEITNGDISINKDYYLQFKDYKVLSDVECEITVQDDNGLVSLDDRASGLTMLLLQKMGVLTVDDWVDVPYVVENRKTLLEFLALQMQLYNTGKSIYDEVFKLVNIVSDIASGLWVTTVVAGVVALVNLAQTIFNLVILTLQLVKLLKDLQEVIFPMVRYHKGINVQNWIVKALNFMGYEFETSPSFSALLDNVVLLGSKNDQIGQLAAAVELGDLFEALPDGEPGDGILDPQDFGYTLSETFELMNKMFHTKVAIVDGVVQMRPFNDPFWVNSATYIFPDVKIEQSIAVQNGLKSFNYDEQVSRTVIRYAKDDSDKHTLSNVNGRTSEVIFTPISVTNQKHVNIRGLDLQEIPYSICVRKDATDKLFGFFKKLEEFYVDFQTNLQDIYETYPVLEESALAEFVEFIAAVVVRSGSLKVENDFFSIPKIVYLDPKTNRIPANFKDFIGADTLWTDYHSYKSMAPGFKDSADPTQTNQKILYEGVKIPFGILDFEQTIINSFFTFEGEKVGKFTKIELDVYRDSAVVNFYVFDNWNNNIQGELV